MNATTVDERTGWQKFLNPPSWIMTCLKIEFVAAFVFILIDGYKLQYAIMGALGVMIGTAAMIAFINALITIGIVSLYFLFVLLVILFGAFLYENTGADLEIWCWLIGFPLILFLVACNHYFGWFAWINE